MKKILIGIFALTSVVAYAEGENNVYIKVGADVKSKFTAIKKDDSKVSTKGKVGPTVNLEITREITPNAEIGLGIGYINRRGKGTFEQSFDSREVNITKLKNEITAVETSINETKKKVETLNAKLDEMEKITHTLNLKFPKNLTSNYNNAVAYIELNKPTPTTINEAVNFYFKDSDASTKEIAKKLLTIGTLESPETTGAFDEARGKVEDLEKNKQELDKKLADAKNQPKQKKTVKLEVPRYDSFPLYVTGKYNFILDSDIKPYIKADLGYSINRAKKNASLTETTTFDKTTNTEITYVKPKVGNGLYYAVGVGAEYQNFLTELAYVHTDAKIKWSNGEKSKYNNNAVRLSVGYKFSY